MPDMPDVSNFPESLRSCLGLASVIVLQTEFMVQAGKKIPAGCNLNYD
jgi:hypothetical protein